MGMTSDYLLHTFCDSVLWAVEASLITSDVLGFFRHTLCLCFGVSILAAHIVSARVDAKQ